MRAEPSSAHGGAIRGGAARSSSSALTSAPLRFVRAVATLPIRIYSHAISPALPRRCRYEPTCSAYALEAVRSYGVARGAVLAAWRLLRCNPFSDGGYDPVEAQRLFAAGSAADRERGRDEAEGRGVHGRSREQGQRRSGRGLHGRCREHGRGKGPGQDPRDRIGGEASVR